MDVGPAGECLERQAEDPDNSNSISLSALWRACGSPLNRTPRRWLQGAGAPIVEGFARYFANLDREDGKDAGDRAKGVASELLWEVTEDRDETWHAGDVMSTYFVALIYSAYLDGSQLRDDLENSDPA